MNRPTLRIAFAPLALAIFALAGCNNSSDSSSSATKPAGSVAAVAAPAGTSWTDNVSATADGFRMGNPKAAITLIEYGSFTCPHCRDFQAEGHEAIERDFVNTGKVNFEYRSMIRDPVDLTVALIAYCAPPESFFALNSQLFANQDEMIKAFSSRGQDEQQALGKLPPEQRFVKIAEMANLIEFAKQRGLPEAKVRACLTDTKKAQTLADHSEAVTKQYPQFAGTPSFILNGTLLDSTASWSALKLRLSEAGA